MELDYFLLLPITIIIAWTHVFILNGRMKELHDRIILVFAASCALTYYIHIHALIEGTDTYHFILLDNIETVVGLSICPLLLFYVRSVAHDSRWQNWYCWFFLPAAIIGSAGTALSFAVGWGRILEIRANAHSSFIPNPDRWTEILYYWINIRLFNITLELMAAGMLAMCIYYLIQYKKHAENFYSNLENSSVRALRNFLIYSILNMIILFLQTFFCQNIVNNETHPHLLVSFVISIFLWMMAKYSYLIKVEKKDQEVICDISAPEPTAESAPHNNYIEKLLTQWDTGIEKTYCQEGITLAEVAREMNISPRALSAYINQTKNMNFRRWINTLRIEESKRLMKKNTDEKITYIATLCGYPDLASFSKAFHSIEGCSPQEYRGKISNCH